MSEDRVVSASVQLWLSQPDALRFAFEEHLLDNLRWEGDPNIPVRLELVIEGRSSPIYVSRPSERVVVGGHLVAFLPLEWDHQPDDWTPTLYEIRANGTPLARADLERILAVCGPPERVGEVRRMVALIDARTGW